MDVINRMAKPDLQNECERLGLSIDGNTEELRNRLCEFHLSGTGLATSTIQSSNEFLIGDREDDNDSVESEKDPRRRARKASYESSEPQPKIEPSDATTIPTNFEGDPMTFLMTLLMRQEDNRRREEMRFREDQARLREEQLRREEAMEKRFDMMLQSQRDFLSKKDSLQSSTSDEYTVTDIQSVKRTVDRIEMECDEVVKSLEKELKTNSSKQEVKGTIRILTRIESRISKILDEKIDNLNGDEHKDTLVKRIYGLTRRIKENLDKGESYVEKIEKREKKEDKAGALPSSFKVPSFDGNVLNFRSWWDEFRALVHENANVSRFYKMRYLLQAMTGPATAILAGKECLETEYDECVDLIRKRFGREHQVVRQVVNSMINTSTPVAESTQFGNFLEEMQNRVAALATHKATTDMILVPIIESHLPIGIRMSWERRVHKLTEEDQIPTTKDLFGFCQRELDALFSKSEVKKESKTTKRDNKIKSDKQGKNEKSTSAQSLVARESKQDNVKGKGKTSTMCYCCDGEHDTTTCDDFKSMSKEDRRKLVEKKRLCFRCINVIYTPKEHRCRVKKCDACGRYHNQLLNCPSVDNSNESTSSLIAVACNNHIEKESSLTTNGRIVSNEEKVVSPTVLAKARSGNKQVTVRLALDTMCEKTFVNQNVAKRLELKPIGTKQVSIQGFGAHEAKIKVAVVEMELIPTNCDESTVKFEAYVKSGPLSAPMNAVTFRLEDHPHLQGLTLGDPNVAEGSGIDILVGNALLNEILLGNIIRPQGGTSRLSAFETKFGFALMGPLSTNVNEKSSCLLSQTSETALWDLCENRESSVALQTPECDLEKFWKLDSLGILDDHARPTAAEQRAVELFQKETIFNGERYEIPLPFKEDAESISNNFSGAKKLLESTERRLLRNPDHKKKYVKAMRDLVELQFARELTPQEVERFEAEGDCYYIPHHGVVKESSVSTKFRLVFNASHPDRNGVSLNDCLLTGPALQPDLGGVLLRFRTNKIALSGDIEKMFPQTKILPDYYKFQLFLWRDCDQDIEPRKMVMTSLMFGINYSPCGAISCTHTHAERQDMVLKYPKLCSELKKSLYVDDFQSGGDDVSSVKKLFHDAVAFFKSGGWRLTKFASNSQEIMDVIPLQDRHPHTTIDLDNREQATPTALGLLWDTSSDNFHINVTAKMLNIPDVITKRVILSTLSSVYDIFGFLSGYLITAKIQMQRIWQLKVDWDETLPEQEVLLFKKWASKLKDISSIAIPRHLFLGSTRRNVILHGFCDASERAYGGMVYVVFQNDDNESESILVMAKTRVAPLKSQTIARLELMAALVLARLVKYVSEHLQLAITTIYLWTDSEITLAWIRKPSSTWKIFVRNRVEEIHNLSDIMMWNFCPGKENPADVISRGISLDELRISATYWKGPPWLTESRQQWPANRTKESEIDHENHDYQNEIAPKVLITREKDIEPPPDVITKCSSYQKSKRLLAYLLRYIYIRSNKKQIGEGVMDLPTVREKTNVPELSCFELQRAEEGLIRDVQRRHFGAELLAIKAKKRLPVGSRLNDYDPFIDEDSGMLRVGGRLRHSNLPKAVRYPIVLPSNDLVTDRIVEDHHLKGQHATIETTLSLLRQKYFVIHARQVTKRVINHCSICKHYRTKGAYQKMGDLPPHRVVPAPAFSEVGLDFTGALTMRNESTTTKGYILVFTCPRSRMIHLELCPDMTTEEFLQALRRFMNRRGWCHTIESDNQTTFKKAKKLLEIAFAGRLLDDMDAFTIKRFMSENGITWRFITERSPFRGAYWERMNRSLKEPLRKVLGKSLLRYTELYTILTDIEATLNQRPLAYHGTDPNDPTPITPSQLTIGRNLREVPDMRDRGKVTVGKRYRYLQSLLRSFWKRWTSDYLPKLFSRGKWKHEEVPVKTGDVVLVSETNTSRPTWPMGRVIEAIAGKDGLVRTVRVKTKSGIITRPVQRLHVLEKADTNECISTDLKNDRAVTATKHHNTMLAQGPESQGEENVVKYTASGRKVRRPTRLDYN